MLQIQRDFNKILAKTLKSVKIKKV